jgi:hypothetical protein
MAHEDFGCAGESVTTSIVRYLCSKAKLELRLASGAVLKVAATDAGSQRVPRCLCRPCRGIVCCAKRLTKRRIPLLAAQGPVADAVNTDYAAAQMVCCLGKE